MIDALVTAETAPLAVQLWPTRAPKFAPNFTLAEVSRSLNGSNGEVVRWTYESGTVRTFTRGERVAVRVESREVLAGADVEWV